MLLASIEGRIRDLGLAEVLQLLARSRKTGVLHCDAPLLSRRARVDFVDGAIVDATVAAVGAWAPHEARPPEVDADSPRAREEAVLEVLCWRDGTFRFAPDVSLPAAEPMAGRARLPMEPLLIEAAQRVLVWDRIESLVPHARVVPAFADVASGGSGPLRLTPPQWEVLAHVDGVRDLVALATSTQRDFVDVAERVYELMLAGLLMLREAPVAPRRNPTPPISAVLPPILGAAMAAEDLSVPDGVTGANFWMLGDHGGDAVVDPVKGGGLTPEGLPCLEAPRTAPAVAVATTEAGPSCRREQAAISSPAMPTVTDGSLLCRQGDDLLRTGDLMGAVAFWEAALRATRPVDDAERLRDVIALATRLHALVSWDHGVVGSHPLRPTGRAT
jgi:hypothetical protein